MKLKNKHTIEMIKVFFTPIDFKWADIERKTKNKEKEHTTEDNK
jgi:hypothetical protein